MDRAARHEDDGALRDSPFLVAEHVFRHTFVDDDGFVMRMGVERDAVSRRALFKDQAETLDRLASGSSGIGEDGDLRTRAIIVGVVEKRLIYRSLHDAQGGFLLSRGRQ